MVRVNTWRVAKKKMYSKVYTSFYLLTNQLKN